MKRLLHVDNLSVSFNVNASTTKAVNNISYHINKGETVAIVGESGSGKSVSQLAVLQLLPIPPAKINSGQVLLEGDDLLKYQANDEKMREIRGGKIGMIFQEPMTSLNPVKRIGDQITESIMIHKNIDKSEARKQAIDLLKQVRIPNAEKRIDDYPHQFSGGMRQRIMIAIALAGDPKLIIADEPTTALDVTTQMQVLELLKSVTKNHDTALLLVTHNLGIVARYAERIYVMYQGRIVESGISEDIFSRPSHPYTRGLLNAVPRLDDSKDRRLRPIDVGDELSLIAHGYCPFLPRCRYRTEICFAQGVPELRECGKQNHFAACYRDVGELDEIDNQIEQESIRVDSREGRKDSILEVNNLTVSYPIQKGILNRKVGEFTAVDDVSFAIKRGDTFGLVGESGCGKTTVAKSIVRLITDNDGDIIFNGGRLDHLRGRELRMQRRKIQMIFQDPYSSLNPRKSAGALVGEPLIIHKLVSSRAEYDKRVDELFEQVGLSPDMKSRVSHEFSGGQRQRLGIARALACRPELIICDEPVSALDVSIQAQIINLLEDLQQELGLSYLFISHDLSVVKHISDTIAVMYLGKIVEIAPCEDLYDNALHPYTTALLSAVPIPDPAVEKMREREIIAGEVSNTPDRPAGCAFSNRCPYVMDICKQEVPPMKNYGNRHYAACYKY